MNELSELTNKLKQLRPEDRNHIVFQLMKEKYISFIELSNIYTKCLELENKNMLNNLREAEICALMYASYDKKPAKSKLKRRIQLRTLFMLNQSERFNMEKLNEQLEYDEIMANPLAFFDSIRGLRRETINKMNFK